MPNKPALRSVADLAALLRSKRQHRAWRLSVLVLALVVATPILVVFGAWLTPATEVWQHLVDTALQDYIRNSLLLMLGVAVGTLLLGVTTAWISASCEFPARRFFEWALLLPMAIPAYIIAYTYTGLLDFAGPVQSFLREFFGWDYGDYFFPNIRSLGGATIMLSLVLYPYVYLLARAAFLEQSLCVLEAGRTLGATPLQNFWRVSLPMARPAIVAGLLLALMETLADYGTVQYFGVATFTTGIFRTWFGLGDAAAAAQLSGLLMGFVMVLVLLEQWSRREARYYDSRSKRPVPRHVLQGWRRIAALLICIVPLAFGFLIPATQLLVWAVRTAEKTLDRNFLQLVLNSLALAGSAAVVTLSVALFMAYSKRLQGGRWVHSAVRMAGMGYAIPGTVIAIGVMIPFAWFDNSLDAWLRAQFNVSSGLLLSGTLIALLFAYMVRFLAVALQPVEAGLSKIRPSMDDAARSLGYAPFTVLKRMHLPMLHTSLLTAMLLVFVDVLKELPATLVLRPFNFNTLAVRTYELASDERLADAAMASLTIVLVGIIPVILLSRRMDKSRHHD
jgi:iron(III) transport system permease protein